jgi:hypothetical protein
MEPEEHTSNTPHNIGARPPLTRAEVAIGSLSRQLDSRQARQSLTEPITEKSIPFESFAQPPTPIIQSVPVPSVAPTPIAFNPNFTTQASEPSPFVAPAPIYTQPVVAAPPLTPLQPAPVISQPSQQLAQVAIAGQPQKKKYPLALIALNKRAILTTVAAAVVIIGAGGLYSYARWYSAQNTPTKIFSDAMQNSLQTSQVDTQTNTNGTVNTADFDFSNLADPIVSTHQTVNMYGSSFIMAGYGSAKNTYVSYAHFPSTISPTITSLATNGWIQLRDAGSLPAAVNQSLVDVSDPRYQTVGVLTFGTFSQKTRQQLINFTGSEKIYAYNTASVTHTTLNGIKVVAYPIKLNVPFLKIYDESVAADEGFSPTDVQDGVDSLTQWTGAKATFYVDAATHRFVEAKLSKPGQQTTIAYFNYGNANIPNEPETRLNWTEFETVQNMISSQAVNKPAIANTASVVKPTASGTANKI